MRLLAVCAVWFGMLSLPYASMFASRAWLAMLFPLVHVVAGLGLLYLALAQLLNRTHILIEGGRLTVTHGPVPWPGNRGLDVSGVRQLFVHRRSTLGESGTIVLYAVCAFVDGVAIDLVRGLSNHDEARFIEQVIEDHLAIDDDPTANVMG